MSEDAQRSDSSLKRLDVAHQAELLELRRSRDQLAAILDGIAEGVTVQDAHGALIFANGVAASMSGFSSPDEFKQSFPSVVKRSGASRWPPPAQVVAMTRSISR